MNTLTVYLSSSPSSTYIVEDEIYFTDVTDVSFNVDDVSFHKPPLSIKFDWGDLSLIYTELNDFFSTEPNTITQSVYGSPITLIKEYKHTYSPSIEALTTKLSCQVKVTYYDSTSCVFVQPITIYTPSFHAKVEDITLLQTAFIDNYSSVLYTFMASKDGSVIESVYSNTAT